MAEANKRGPRTARTVPTLVGVTMIAALAGCGGGDTVVSEPPPAPTPTSTAVPVRVIDGPIANAVVCLDANGNGACDAGEPRATTAADGRATLDVPNELVGRHPVLAQVGTDAVDADSGPVTVAYTLTAPADRTDVVSPLTTLAYQLGVRLGLDAAAAQEWVRSVTGATASVYADYAANRANDSAAAEAAVLARLLADTLRLQWQAVGGAVGQADGLGGSLSRQAVEGVLWDALRQQLGAAATAIAGGLRELCRDGGTSAACREAIRQQAQSLAAASGLTAAAVPALARASGAAPSTPAATPVATAQLRALSYGGSPTADFLYRMTLANATENTPVDGRIVFRNVRRARVGGTQVEWTFGSEFARRGDLHWNGSAWVGCPDASFQNSGSVRDVAGRSSYNFCDGFERGVDRLTFESVAGRPIAEVVAQIRAFPSSEGGRPFAEWGNALDGTPWTAQQIAQLSGTMPDGARLLYSSVASTATAPTYDVRDSNRVAVWSAAVAAGGDARSNPAVACNGSAIAVEGPATTLETLIARNPGTPCVFAPSPAGATFGASGPRNEWWGNSTISLGTIGTVPTGTPGSGPLPADYYTGNTLLRVAFAGGSSNAVTYYSCTQRRSNGSQRNCDPIGSGSYVIEALGDARVMRFVGLPVQTNELSFQRVFVERAGAVYFGYRERPAAFAPTVRLNLEAGNALLQALGLPLMTP